MNKQIAVFSSLAALTFSLALPASARDSSDHGDHTVARAFVGWESEYVFRGIQASKYAVRPGAEIVTEDFYGGFLATLSADSDFSHQHELNFHAGLRHDVDDLLLLDMGGILYYFPRLDNELPDATDVSGELFFGVGLDLLGQPWLYSYYDVELEDFTMEGRLEHQIVLDEDWWLDLAAIGGHAWVREGKVWAAPNENYLYSTLKADLRYAIDEAATLSVGGRLSGNELGDGVREQLGGANASNLWWTASFSAKF